MVFTGMFFTIEGLILNAPGALKMMSDYIVWPLVYLILLTSLKDRKLLAGLHLTIVFSTIFLSLYGLTHLLADLSILPDFFAFTPFKSETIGFGHYEGYIEMTTPGVNSLPFLLPYCIAALIAGTPPETRTSVKNYWLWIAVISGLIFSLITARRAVWLVIILTPGIVLLLRLIANPVVKKSIVKVKTISKVIFIVFPVLIAVYFLIAKIYDFSLSGILKTFASGFQISSGNESARYEQFFALLQGWLDHPIFGSGLGATAEKYGSVRSAGMPWSYELYYLALLFQVGILGFMIYTAGVIWTFRNGIIMMKSSNRYMMIMLPFLAGMTGMFIAGGTNPVFMRFDGIWFYFIPVALINNWMLNDETKDDRLNRKPLISP
jgi:hypothetical protein